MGLTYLVRLSLLSVALVGMACEVGPGNGWVEEFQSTLPTSSGLRLAMEADSDAPPTGRVGKLHAPLGAPASGFYDLTVQAMEVVNLDVARLLAPLAEATTTPPVLEAPDTVVWRSTNDAGSEEHLLVIRRMSDGYYDSLMASRSFVPAGSPWRPRLAGSYTPGTQFGQGQGSMWIDLDTDLDPGTSGTLLVLWSALEGEREIAVFEYALTTAGGDLVPRNGSSGFHENADLSGSFAFSGRIAIPQEDGEDSTQTDALIVSRWTAQAEGRSDAHVTGPAAIQQGFDEEVASQCWKAHGKVTTFDAIVGQKKDSEKEGKVDHKTLKSQGRVEDCPFLEPADAVLPSRPAKPPAPLLPPQAH
jgi:hypothetical protein